MKTTKLFFMAALALMTAACSSNDDELAQQPAKANGITITAQLAPKGGFANTRAVETGKDTQEKDIIKASWEVDEHLAILYSKDGNQMADARIKSVDGSGNATIEFTVVDGTAENTECTIIYPLSAAKDDKTGVKAYADMLATQDGTLSASLDVRVGAGTIQTSTPSLTVTTQPEAQFSIFRFGFQNLGNVYFNTKKLIVSDASGNVITTVTQTPALSTMYVALPELAAGTYYWLNVTEIDVNTSATKPYIRKVKIETATSAGTFYDALVKMASLGDIMCTDGSFYDTQTEADNAGKTAVAIIAYIGSETGDANHKHGLAIAISDEMESGTTRKETSWQNAKNICEGKTAVTGATWYMPSLDQWKTMFKANNGGDDTNCTGLKNAIGSSAYYNSSNDPSLATGYFWSSTEKDGGNVIQLYFWDDGSYSTASVPKNYVSKFRAVLAF